MIQFYRNPPDIIFKGMFRIGSFYAPTLFWIRQSMDPVCKKSEKLVKITEFWTLLKWPIYVPSCMTISSTLFVQQNYVSALLGVRSWTLHHQLFPKAIQLSWPQQKRYFQTINVSPTFLIQNVHISVSTDDFHLQLFHNLVSPHFHHNKLDPDILEISSQL